MSEMYLSTATRTSSVAVIGAGISGLCAAQALTTGGIHVTIFEKARGVGGRTSTRREREYTFDHGAQFFTVAEKRFRELVHAWETAGIVAQWDVPIVVLNKGRVRDAGDARPRFVGVPGMNAMARHLAKEMDIVLNTRITRCERHENQWHVFDGKDDLIGAFDAVIVTAPPEQATPLLQHSPSLLATLGTVQLSPCWALMAAFDRRLDVPFDGAFVEKSIISWVARNGSKPMRPNNECWVIHASPEWSEMHREHEPQYITEQLMSAFYEEVDVPSTEPVSLQAHRWRYAKADNPLSAACLWDAQLNAGACGDWCLAARIEGAAMSGFAIAERVLGCSVQPPLA